MSRTDKDTPYWVRAEYYTPYHGCGWMRIPTYRDVERQTRDGIRYVDWVRTGYRWTYRGDCELPDYPRRRHPGRWTHRNGKSRPLCSWEPESPWASSSQLRGVHKTYWCRTRFHKPQRNNTRMAARRAVQGDWETEFPDGRTRHSIAWIMD